MDETRTGQSAEFTAKSVEDALVLASKELGIPASALEYEILEDTTRTILGFVRTGEVTIRVIPPVDVSERAEPVPQAEDVQPERPQRVEMPAQPEQPEEAPPTPARRPANMERNPPEMAATAQEVVATLLDKMGLLAAVEIADPGGKPDLQGDDVSPLVLNVVGDDLDILIGHRGDTLRDLQFITRLIVSRRLGVWPNFVIDVEGYKARRVDTLNALANRLAAQVRETGRLVVLEPMPAYERRIIHIALRDVEDVYTKSIGEDEGRKVQILPK